MATMKEVLADKQVAKELLSKQTPEEAQAFLKGKGVEVSLEDIKALGKALQKKASGELSDDDMEAVAGGSLVEETFKEVFDGLTEIVEMAVDPSNWRGPSGAWYRW